MGEAPRSTPSPAHPWASLEAVSSRQNGACEHEGAVLRDVAGSSEGSATLLNPLFLKRCFFTGAQRNWASGGSVVPARCRKARSRCIQFRIN
jgi:hypothetical protein